MARRASRSTSRPLPLLPAGRWTVVTAAFLAGLLLFVVVWLKVRQPEATADATVQPAAISTPASPLPAPAPAGTATPLPAPQEQAQLIEEAVIEPPPPVAEAPLPPNVEEDLARPVDAPAPAPATAMQPPQRLPGQPAPSYPPGALRRGESGTVVVSVEVGVDGRPASISLDERSGSRDLDRAALDAVSRWRFEPARDANGQAVPGYIQVPIEFTAQ
jgi:protein TonB